MKQLLFDEPFVAVFPSLVKELGGDVSAAAVLQHIHFRSGSKDSVYTKGYYWYSVNLEELSEEIGISRKQARRLVNKLKERGYLEIDQFGSYDRTNYYRVIMDSSIGTKRAYGKNPKEVDATAHNGTLHNLLQEEIQEVVQESEANLFDEFWSIYPRKSDKASAKKSFTKAIKKVSWDVLHKSVTDYRDDPNRIPQYTLHAKTWLNNGRWDDEPLPARSSNTSGDKRMAKTQTMIDWARQQEDAKRLETIEQKEIER